MVNIVAVSLLVALGWGVLSEFGGPAAQGGRAERKRLIAPGGRRKDASRVTAPLAAAEEKGDDDRLTQEAGSESGEDARARDVEKKSAAAAPSPASTPEVIAAVLPSVMPSPARTPAPSPARTPAPSPTHAPALSPAGSPAPPPPAASAPSSETGPYVGIKAYPPIDVVATSRFAYVTMAAGNEAGRMATALIQSLLDTGTDTSKIDIVVLLARGGVLPPGCNEREWRDSMGLPAGSECHEQKIPEEIISPYLTASLRKQGAKLVVIEAIPSTPMTIGIPGGRGSFWGMALNKLVVFNMTQYEKVRGAGRVRSTHTSPGRAPRALSICSAATLSLPQIVWCDSDTFALKNLDHLFGPEYTTFTGALTEACCLQNGPGIPSGG